MDRHEFQDWVDRYAAPFGMTDERDRLMFDSWFDVFARMGYTLAELELALVTLQAEPPANRWAHLEAIHREVTAARRRDLARRQEAERLANDRGTCTLCGDTGAVVVPHPRCVGPVGTWQGAGLGGAAYTAAVSCTCRVGRNADAAYENFDERTRKRIPRLMTLEEYQRANPRWRAMMAELDAQQQAAALARDRTEDADKHGRRLRVDFPRAAERAAAG